MRSDGDVWCDEGTGPPCMCENVTPSTRGTLLTPQSSELVRTQRGISHLTNCHGRDVEGEGEFEAAELIVEATPSSCLAGVEGTSAVDVVFTAVVRICFGVLVWLCRSLSYAIDGGSGE